MSTGSMVEKNFLFRVLFVALFLSAFGCNNNDTEEPVSVSRGDLVSSEYLSGYTAAVVSGILKAADIEVDIEIKYDVDVYSVVYLTPGKDDNTLLLASGAVMVPKGDDEFSALAFQHGTETRRDLVASENPMVVAEGVVGIVSASAGFVTFVPDYLGMGISEMLHPYLHHRLSAGPVLDIIRAGKIFCEQNGITLIGDLYLGGYSEGGYVTLAAQEEIEKLSSFGFELIASSPQAGPYDLTGTVDHYIEIDEYPEPAFMAFLLTAYDDVYGWDRINDIFKQPYAAMMYDLFDGTHRIGEISSQLPSKISDLLTESFIDGYKNGTDTYFQDAVNENTSLDWCPKAKTRFYHSNADEVVPYENMLNAVEKFRENGADGIEMVTIDGLSHGDAGVVAVTGMIEWFDSLRLERR
ncbi:MAG: hypothetical protein GXO47_12325 [Chlorobi bacterium]|nr:hypothetical protein [Chlorobiota bacterium]